MFLFALNKDLILLTEFNKFISANNSTPFFALESSLLLMLHPLG